MDLSTTHRVLSSTGVLSPFARDVLFISIFEALRHRQAPASEASALSETIVTKLFAKRSAEITTTEIKEVAIAVLENFDPIAAKVYEATKR